MSFQAFSRVARAFSFGGSRQFLGRRLGERSSHIRQEKRPATQDEMGMLVLGLGLFTAASVWAWKEGALSSVLTADEQAKLKENE